MNPSHLGLGAITSLVPNKASVKTGIALGLGAAAGITLSDLAQSRALVRNGTPMIPTAWSPLFSALFGLVVGGMVKKKYSNVGLGMIAGGVGIGIAALVAKYTSPAAAASAASAASAEEMGAGSQAIAGFGLGRAYARGLAGLGAGLGAMRADPSHLFGVGTPDMSASRMFNGATVAVEETGGPMSGASVAIETPSAFAGVI